MSDEELAGLQKSLKDRCLWLTDVGPYPDSGNPHVALLVRIEEFLGKHGPPQYRGENQRYYPIPYGENVLEDIRFMQTEAAIGYPGNLQQAAGEYDPSAYAAELHRAEWYRVNYPKNCRELFPKLEKTIPNGIWCMPYVDFDINFKGQIPFLEQMRMHKYPVQHFLVDDDPKQTLSERFVREMRGYCWSVTTEQLVKLYPDSRHPCMKGRVAW